MGSEASANADGRQTLLLKLLDFASTNYQHQIGLFLQHRSGTLRALAAVGGAPVALLGFLSARPGPTESFWFKVGATIVLLLLGKLCHVLAGHGLSSAMRSYKGSLEYAAMVTKVMFELGATGLLERLPSQAAPKRPFPEDQSIHVPRFVEDALSANDKTDETRTSATAPTKPHAESGGFVAYHMEKPGSTLKATVRSINWMQWVGITLAFLALVAVWA